jgi:hypothetical protein
MTTPKQVDIARANLLKASKELGFKVITPFVLDGNNLPHVAFAYLPDYGSPRGTVVGLISAPTYETDKAVERWAEANNCFYSFLNVEALLAYSQEYFLELLKDWAEYGSHEAV